MPLDLNWTNPHTSGGRARKRPPSTTPRIRAMASNLLEATSINKEKRRANLYSAFSLGVCARLCVVRGQHGLAPGRQEIPHLADLREPPNQRSINPPLHCFLA